MDNQTINTTKTNFKNENTHKATVLNTIGWTCIAIIVIGILQLLLMSPLFMSGNISWHIFQLLNEEFQQQLGTTGQATFKFFECIASLLTVAWLLKRDNKNFTTVGLSTNGFFLYGLIAFALATLVLLIGSVLLIVTNNIDFIINEFSSVPWLANIGLFIAVAIGKEVLFRGYIQQRLTTAAHLIVAVVIASATFLPASFSPFSAK